MYITLNGTNHQCSEPQMNIEHLLQSLSIPLETTVVECNGEIIPATAWATSLLQENDCLEVVRFVGGG